MALRDITTTTSTTNATTSTFSSAIISDTNPLTSANWQQYSADALGRGVYHIRSPADGTVYAVYVLRPAMSAHADPYSKDGALVPR